MFVKQMGRTQQLLSSLQQKPSVPSYMISALQVELINLDSIYTSYKPLISAATQLLRREPAFNGVSPFSNCTRRGLLSFLGDALSWLTGTATTKDVSSIKNRVIQLITTQHKQETLVKIISVLNVTIYAMQVNRQCINLVMDAVERTHHDITVFYNITNSLYTNLNYQQSVLHIHSILANLRFPILHETCHHACNGLHRCSYNWYTITSCTTSRGFQKMLIHIEEALLSAMHLPVSAEDTLHFYRYLCTHILITDKQFLLLTDVPIQDHTQ